MASFTPEQFQQLMAFISGSLQGQQQAQANSVGGPAGLHGDAGGGGGRRRQMLETKSFARVDKFSGGAAKQVSQMSAPMRDMFGNLIKPNGKRLYFEFRASFPSRRFNKN